MQSPEAGIVIEQLPKVVVTLVSHIRLFETESNSIIKTKQPRKVFDDPTSGLQILILY